MNLAEVFVESRLIPELQATTKDDAIRELLGVLQRTRKVPKARVPEVLKALLRREDLGSTSIGRGVGVPHVKHPAVSRIVGAFGRSTAGIDYQAVDGEPVHLVFLLISPADAGAGHLNALKRISALAKDGDLPRFLLRADGVAGITEIMCEADESLTV